MCDGSEVIRVAIGGYGGGALDARDLADQQSQGTACLYIDGHCRLWTQAAHLEVRSAQLSAGEWALLARRLLFSDWLQWNGTFGRQPLDGGPWFFWTGSRASTDAGVRMYAVCDPEDATVPEALCAALEASGPCTAPPSWLEAPASSRRAPCAKALEGPRRTPSPSHRTAGRPG